MEYDVGQDGIPAAGEELREEGFEGRAERLGRSFFVWLHRRVKSANYVLTILVLPTKSLPIGLTEKYDSGRRERETRDKG